MNVKYNAITNHCRKLKLWLWQAVAMGRSEVLEVLFVVLLTK